jgi:cardiolipin synthase
MPSLALEWEVLVVRGYAVSLLVNLATIPVILLSPKTPQGKIAWILVVLGVPGGGLAFYWIWGRSRLKRKVLTLRHGRASYVEAAERPFREAVVRQLGGGLSAELARTAEVMGAFPPYPGNDVLLLAEGPEAFAAGLEAIDGARDHVHVATYIIRADRTGQQAVAALARAAARGVDVRLLYDSWGSLRTSRKLFRPLRRAGGHVAAFLPVGLLHPGLRINLRNHRKILVVDGRIAFTGGMNIANEWAGLNRWRDVQVRIVGPGALGLQRVFLEDWQFATGDRLADKRYFRGAAPRGEVPVQVVAGGPDREVSQIEELFFAAIATARKRVDIMTPYFLPPEPLVAAIRAVVLRGLPVRLLVPARTDHLPVHLAMQAVLPRLMERGLEVWAYPRMLHGKVLVVDDEWGTLGSANMDARSLRLNFELNVAFPHPPTATALRTLIDHEIARSRRLSVEELRFGLVGTVLRSAAGLMAPIL